MIVLASTLRSVRRPRRFPSVGSLVRELGSVEIHDSSPARLTLERPEDSGPRGSWPRPSAR